jgi:integrase
VFAAPLSASMSFSQAAESFLESRKAPVARGRVQYVSPRTLRDYRYYLKTLTVHFGEIPLGQIGLREIAKYEERRAAGEGFTRIIGNRKGGERVSSPAGANKIRSEISLLIRILKRANCWPEVMSDVYLPLQQTDSDVPRALSPDEQDRFLAVAGTAKRWEVVLWYSMVALHLTWSTDEMRTIRIGDINLHSQIISVNRRYGKNKYRRRVTPICDPGCAWALERLIAV